MQKNEPDRTEFEGYQEHDIQDLIYYSKLTPEQKLDHLENLIKSLIDIMPTESKENWRKLKELGF